MNKFNKYLLATSSIILIFSQTLAVGPKGLNEQDIKFNATQAALGITAAKKIHNYVDDKVKHHHLRSAAPSIVNLKDTFRKNAIADKLNKEFASKEKEVTVAAGQDIQVRWILSALAEKLTEEERKQKKHNKDYIDHPNTREATNHNRNLINQSINGIANEYHVEVNKLMNQLPPKDKTEFMQTSEYKAAMENLRAMGFEEKGLVIDHSVSSLQRGENIFTHLHKVAKEARGEVNQKRNLDLQSNTQEDRGKEIARIASTLAQKSTKGSNMAKFRTVARFAGLSAAKKTRGSSPDLTMPAEETEDSSPDLEVPAAGSTKSSNIAKFKAAAIVLGLAKKTEDSSPDLTVLAAESTKGTNMAKLKAAAIVLGLAKKTEDSSLDLEALAAESTKVINMTKFKAAERFSGLAEKTEDSSSDLDEQDHTSSIQPPQGSTPTLSTAVVENEKSDNVSESIDVILKMDNKALREHLAPALEDLNGEEQDQCIKLYKEELQKKKVNYAAEEITAKEVTPLENQKQVENFAKEAVKIAKEAIEKNREVAANDSNDLSPEEAKKVMQDEINSAATTETRKKLTKITDFSAKIVTKTINTVENTLEKAADNILQRLSTKILNLFQISDDMGMVSAGEETSKNRFGVWSSFSLGRGGGGKKIKYKTSSYGGALGMDYEIADDILLGISGHISKGNSDFINTKSKSDITSYLISLYTVGKRGKILWESSVFAGKSNVDTTTQKANSAQSIAKSKSSLVNYGTETRLGYDIANNDKLSIIPTVGFRYAHFNNSAAKEKGAGIFNTEKSAHTVNRIVLIAGGRLVGTIKFGKSSTIFPEIYGFMRYRPLDEASGLKVKITATEQEIEYTEKNPIKFRFNTGVALNGVNGDFSYGINLNLHKARSYHNITGTLKLKIKL